MKDNQQWEKVIQAYAASISFSDAMVGRLLDAFNNSDYVNNTIVVLWSDHGMHMGEKENIEKFTLWEKSTRVPLIISVPGLTKSGSKCDQAVSLMDIYPTLADITGLEKPPHLDGQSLFPQIKDPKAPTSPVISTYRFTWREQPITGHAVRSLRFRYIYYPEINLEELYDHVNDPNEWHNIAYKEENKQIIAEHREVLLAMLPQLSWTDLDPVGYSIDSDGHVSRIGGE